MVNEKSVSINNLKDLTYDDFYNYCHGNNVLKIKPPGSNTTIFTALSSYDNEPNRFALTVSSPEDMNNFLMNVNNNTCLGVIIHHNALVGLEFKIKKIVNDMLICESPTKIYKLDARKEPRYCLVNAKNTAPLHMNVTIPEYSLKPVHIKLLDLSFEGCALLVPQEMISFFSPKNELKILNLKLEGVQLTLSGTIRNNFEYSPQFYKVGIQFTKLNMLGQKILMQYFEKLLQS